MKFKVAITDYNFTDLVIEETMLCPLARIEAAQCRTEQEVARLAADADVVITQLAPVRAEAIAAMRRARAIIRYGIGVDNVDLAAAAARGIPVCNVPDYCLDEVADHALALMLALTRQVVPNALLVRAGKWQVAGSINSLRTLRTTTVGVAGFGRIGRAVVRRLVPFGGRVLVFDPAVPAAAIGAEGAESAPWSEVVAQSDVITLHCPSLPATRGLVRRGMLERMKPGALLVNTSRGDLVVLADLIEALESGRLAGAALDVTDPEPLPTDSPLRSMPQVILHAHIAWASGASAARLRRTVGEIAACALRGEPMINVINGVNSSSA